MFKIIQDKYPSAYIPEEHPYRIRINHKEE